MNEDIERLIAEIRNSDSGGNVRLAPLIIRVLTSLDDRIRVLEKDLDLRETYEQEQNERR
jgi:hypothetical protein